MSFGLKSSTGTGFSNLDVTKEMLPEDFCNRVISNFYGRVIGGGDYYTLDWARKMIEARQFKPGKERRLIGDLKLINECRGISAAKDLLRGKELESFRQSLRELEGMGINAVTIPRDWGIQHIPKI